jgi:hypothetical protein
MAGIVNFWLGLQAYSSQLWHDDNGSSESLKDQLGFNPQYSILLIVQAFSGLAMLIGLMTGCLAINQKHRMLFCIVKSKS